ncbi:nucleosome assembly protein 1, putative [Theileria equi strain WA]|uniref:Nucleosome assembly protein 1, putative n=1 Tax=Theileria equi strain WA TaxID=1537102 RepID=L0AZN4_THEEQ|nr:nucleosome assembly protein 1, putative [Theileria equi strain WA]AFZ81057.1 nucleosome assembly protein 1, putative [Theileria equi strain WA]|eukprot:XP_004830723.1 nucleosome assembly protein 1, putative [Theileria equi strain WA]
MDDSDKMDLEALRARQIELSNELNTRLTGVYRWYYGELDRVSDEMIKLLNEGQTPLDVGPEGVEKQQPSGGTVEREMDSIINVESATLGTKNWPSFWLHALLGCKRTRSWISDLDCVILAYLNDVRVIVHEANEVEESFQLCFHFVENPYFSNRMLSRRFDFERGNVTSTASEISWTCEASMEDIKVALAIKDRIIREPLKYVLRYRDADGGQESEDESSDETDSGSRYPFSWLF